VKIGLSNFESLSGIGWSLLKMLTLLEDHKLPLVQLKERRRDLIVGLMGHQGPLSKQQIAEIAAIQTAISAIEAVLDDLDAEAEVALRDRAA
jgi:hypothetical protein